MVPTCQKIIIYYQNSSLKLRTFQYNMGCVTTKPVLGGGVAINKDEDQPMRQHSLISAFVIRLSESIVSRLATHEISTL